MNTRPTPETDAFFATFADGEYAPSHAEYYARLQDLERERDEAREELNQWRTLPQKVEDLIPQTNIPLSAAVVRTTAIYQVLDLITAITNTTGKETA
jgi:serine protease inhibitor